MWPDPQETADLVTFTEEILNENFIFCAVWQLNLKQWKLKLLRIKY